MTVLIVSESAETRARVADIAREILPDAAVLCHEGSLAALADARAHEVGVAVIDVELPELNGLDLGQYLTEMYPMLNVVFVSEGKAGAFDAMRLHASGYLLKPLSDAELRRELKDLRRPPESVGRKRVFAQTFGNFELFVDGAPVTFKYTRTKEIVALLVNNRGAQTTNGEIIASLWEDDGDPDRRASYLSNLRQDLQNTMARLKLTGIILKQRGSLAIAAERIECDLYDWLAKGKASKYRYLGDYMNQYSWAEFMHAELDEISYAMDDDG